MNIVGVATIERIRKINEKPSTSNNLNTENITIDLNI